jgi:aminodeoxyfutalosine deaminase
MSIEESIKKLPKVEQHVHIVGSVRPETLLWLIEQSDLSSKYKTLDDLNDFYAYRDFDHFLNIYSTVNDLITEEKHYETITYQMLQNQHRCNVKHVECIFSAYDHMHRGLSFHDMVDYINRAIRRAHREFGITCNIRVDLVRNYGPEIGWKVLDEIISDNDNIVGIDTGGTEYGYSPKLYEGVYAAAKEQGLRLVAHQGEAAGVDYVWACVNYLKPERIGHGVSAAKDPKLLATLAERGISIETCPISNLRTGAVDDLKHHPIRDFIAAGIKVSVNSDDPPMFGTDMNNEYLQLHKVGFTLEELHGISLDSIKMSFISNDEKQRLIKTFQREYEKLV